MKQTDGRSILHSPIHQAEGLCDPRADEQVEGKSLRKDLDVAKPLGHATVLIPALNESARIASVVRHALADPATDEVIVIDDSSIDATVAIALEAGAKVIRSSMLGKGTSMSDGLAVARNDLVVYLDGDLAGLREHIITDLCKPLIAGEADFVKARFGRSGGRVTELTAKPMLKVFFPELAQFSQPLGGMIAARTSLLKTLQFEDGYGVDVGLLIDAHTSGAKLAEVDIGDLENDSQPLFDLAAMANEVSRVIFNRARHAGRLHIEQVSAMYESQRQATATLEYAMARRRGRSKVLLISLDGVITFDNFVDEIAKATGQSHALSKLRKAAGSSCGDTSEVAKLFQFVHRQQFERVAREMPLRPDAIDCVNRLRRAGYIVGLLSDNYFVAAEILRRRVFADFGLAHTLQFNGDVCSGELRINPAFLPEPEDGHGTICKGHITARIRNDSAFPKVSVICAVSSADADIDLLESADQAFLLVSATRAKPAYSQCTRISSLTELADLLVDGDGSN